MEKRHKYMDGYLSRDLLFQKIDPSDLSIEHLSTAAQTTHRPWFHHP